MKISVITPSYNQPRYLQLCVASVADQERVAFEHIIQDAGSDIDLKQLLGNTPNVQIFVERDAGMYDAINRGLKKATGDICSYLNCDERSLPGTLAKVRDFFTARPDVDVVFGDMVLINADGQPLSYRRTILPTKMHTHLSHLNTASCATFFRRRLVDRGFLFDPDWKTIGDVLWVESLLQAKIKMMIIPEPLAVFTLTGHNLGATSTSLAEMEGRRKDLSLHRFKRIAAVITHRLRKAFAGAYLYRRVNVLIYTLSSPSRRKLCGNRLVGFRWPA